MLGCLSVTTSSVGLGASTESTTSIAAFSDTVQSFCTASMENFASSAVNSSPLVKVDALAELEGVGGAVLRTSHDSASIGTISPSWSSCTRFS